MWDRGIAACFLNDAAVSAAHRMKGMGAAPPMAPSDSIRDRVEPALAHCAPDGPLRTGVTKTFQPFIRPISSDLALGLLNPFLNLRQTRVSDLRPRVSRQNIGSKNFYDFSVRLQSEGLSGWLGGDVRSCHPNTTREAHRYQRDTTKEWVGKTNWPPTVKSPFRYLLVFNVVAGRPWQ